MEDGALALLSYSPPNHTNITITLESLTPPSIYFTIFINAHFTLLRNLLLEPVIVCYYALFSSLLLGKSKEAERKRINKELANIRSKFKGKIRELFITHDTHTHTHTHTLTHTHTHSITHSLTYTHNYSKTYSYIHTCTQSHSFSTHFCFCSIQLVSQDKLIVYTCKCTVNTSLYKKTVFHV